MRFAVFFLLLSIPVRADQLVLPHPLSNNTVADAEAVQANFSILIAESNENDLRLGAIEGVLGFDASLENTVVGNGLQANNPDLSFSEYSGGYSTAIGYDALLSNTKGWSNTAVGAWSLLSNTEGYRNTALGTVTLSSNIEGDGNVAVGFNALYYNKSGSYNTAVGYESLVNNLTGRNNTAIGVAALAYNTEGNSNTGLGDFALYNNVSAGTTPPGIRRVRVIRGRAINPCTITKLAQKILPLGLGQWMAWLPGQAIPLLVGTQTSGMSITRRQLAREQ